MRFVYSAVPSLPLLAWCARLRPGLEEIEVVHGPWVEIRPSGFFEGAWSGPFDEMGFVESTACFGTGARLNGEEVEFAGTTAPMRALLSMRLGDDLLVSNSIPFLLAQAGDEPDLSYLGYHADFLRYAGKGFIPEGGPLPTAGGRTIRFHLFSTLAVGKDLAVRCRPMPSPPPPEGYEEYRDLLVRSLDGLRKNASDPSRMVKYHPITTVSRGYDSPACAALGAAAGWKDAVTLSGGQPDDDGSPVAERLGLSVTRYGYEAWKAIPDAPEAEFVATAGGGVMVRLAAMEKELRGSILLIGVMGEWAWDPAWSAVGPGMARRGVRVMGGESLWEFQLRVGIVVVYPAAVGAVHGDVLQRMSRSEELKPWSVGGSYDRPIARRLVEEAGVPREWFGVRKMASSHARPAEIASKSGREDFERFLAERIPQGPRGMGLPVPPMGAPPWLRYDSPYYFHWGMDRTLRRYSIPSRRASESSPRDPGGDRERSHGSAPHAGESGRE